MAVEAVTKLESRDLQIKARGPQLLMVETGTYTIRFSPSILSYTKNWVRGHNVDEGFSFQVEEKAYTNSNDSTKISFTAFEGKEKETKGKIMRFVEVLMAGITPIPRFSLAEAVRAKKANQK